MGSHYGWPRATLSRRSLRKRRVSVFFLICISWFFGGPKLPLSIMTVVSQTCRQSISALRRPPALRISIADMARLPGFPDNPTEGGRVPGPSCGVPARGTGHWDKWVPFCVPGGSQGRLSESKRALNSGDPGWIRTSDPQLRRQEVTVSWRFTSFHIIFC
jgi:hypothetical protein